VKGHYIALEGIEGAGKSTVAERLVAALGATGISVLGVREPGGTSAGERIREILLDPAAVLSPWAEALLFAAARSQLAHQELRAALDAGTWVVGDRSVYSSLAYQGAGRRLGVPEVRVVNEFGLDEVWPDLVILLEVDPATGLARQKVPDRIGAEGFGFQAIVAQAFVEMAGAEPDRFHIVDAEVGVDAVVAAIMGEIEARW
jgi:dTMP kinase